MLLQGRIRPTGVGALQLWKRNGVAQIPMYEFSTLAHKNFREWEIVNLQASPNPHEQTAARAQQFLAQSIIGIAFTVKFVFECIRIRHHWEFRAPQVELERSKWCHRISISVMIISIQMICSALGIFSSVDPFSRLHIYNTFWFYFFIYALPTTGFVATYTLCLTYMRIVQKFYGNQLFQLHLVRVFLHITMVVLLLSAVSMTIIQGFNMRFSFFSYLYTFNAGLGLVYEIVIAVFFMHTKQKITKSICESNDVKKIGSGAAKDNEKVRRMSYFLQLTSFLFLGIILSTTAFLLLLVFGYDYLWALASQSLFIALSGLTQILSMPRAPSGQDNLPKARKSSVNPSPIRTSIAFN